MSPSMLDSIPGEIHTMILKLLDDRRDINNLCQVSKILYEKTVPYLYRSISLYALEDDLEDIFDSGLDEAGERGLLRHTRDIKLWSHFYEKHFFDACIRVRRSMTFTLASSKRESKMWQNDWGFCSVSVKLAQSDHLVGTWEPVCPRHF
ncbi:hypothetical protein BGZ61DRAFT_51774 [Ilyonectria robusta]|uniref:uncharacterized protein n=1 Tax=Ilyonectria robusta TaxID=1079257 RepID=UPI001E8D3B71|nr:uncharacterized protein BGZ61DRAFT_51774 [Ilyonectria robusta]KAH8686313.1 hypothetical protein BGZ61DRAFT_51774 [Ilyonectria robusta]